MFAFGPSACSAVAGLMDAKTPSPLQLVCVSDQPSFTSLPMVLIKLLLDDPCITLDALNTTLGSLYQVVQHRNIILKFGLQQFVRVKLQ